MFEKKKIKKLKLQFTYAHIAAVQGNLGSSSGQSMDRSAHQRSGIRRGEYGELVEYWSKMLSSRPFKQKRSVAAFLTWNLPNRGKLGNKAKLYGHNRCWDFYKTIGQRQRRAECRISPRELPSLSKCYYRERN